MSKFVRVNASFTEAREYLAKWTEADPIQTLIHVRRYGRYLEGDYVVSYVEGGKFNIELAE